MLALVVESLGTWRILGFAALHLALGAGTVWLTAVAAKGSGLSRWRVLAAAIVCACDPVLVWQSRSVMTETPAAFLVAGTLAGLTMPGWRGPVLGGIGFGLAALCRPSLLAGAALAIVAAAWARPGTARERVIRASLLSLVLLVVLSPWIVRNWLVFGELISVTTHGGYTLALANNPVYYSEVLNGPPGRVWTGDDQWRWWDSGQSRHSRHDRARGRSVLGRSGLEAGARAARRFRPLNGCAVYAFLECRPGRVGVSALGARAVCLAWTLPLWVALFLGFGDRDLWRWPRIAAVMIGLGLTGAHLFYWTDLRMRASIVPAIALVAAGAQPPRLLGRGPAPAEAPLGDQRTPDG